jgi:hypothetical protein
VTNYKNKLLSMMFSLAAVASVGCGDDNGTKDIDTNPIGDAGAKPDSGVKVNDAGPTTSEDGGVTTEDDAGGETPDGGGTTPGCVVKDGCFCGTPKKMEDFLNACTDAETVTKVPVIPGGEDGTLTPL